jgi:arginine/ornithine transport system permease protein
MLVQLFLLYYGLAQFEAVRNSRPGPGCRRPGSAPGGLRLNTCAYTTEILHGAIRALPAGEIEAAKAMGMSRGLLLRRIVLPRPAPALPAYGNEAISCCTAPRWPASSRWRT